MSFDLKPEVATVATYASETERGRIAFEDMFEKMRANGDMMPLYFEMLRLIDKGDKDGYAAGFVSATFAELVTASLA